MLQNPLKPGVAEQRIAKSPDQSEIGAFAFYFSGFKFGGFRLYGIMLAAALVNTA